MRIARVALREALWSTALVRHLIQDGFDVDNPYPYNAPRKRQFRRTRGFVSRYSPPECTVFYEDPPHYVGLRSQRKRRGRFDCLFAATPR
jgi:hypothetical protein